MAAFLIPPAAWLIGGLLAGGWALKNGARFLDEANETTKLALLGGGSYLAFQAYKSLK